MVVHNAMMGNAERIRDFAEKEACGAIMGGLLRLAYADRQGPLSQEDQKVRSFVMLLNMVV